MNGLLVSAGGAFGAALVLTHLVRRWALRWGMIDRPDGRRKRHPQAVARGGGIAVYLALVVGVACLGRLLPWFDTLSALPLLISAGVVCLIGTIDDYFCLRSKLKLVLQTLAVTPILAFGFSINKIALFGTTIELSWWIGLPLTVLWLVGCINSLNLLDGMDGLAGTTGLLAAAMLGIVAMALGNPQAAVLAILLSAALAGFLVFNLPPASIFLGDSGSMVIGLSLGALSMQSALKTPTTLAITIPVVVLSLPMFDTVLAIVRRQLTGRTFDCPDREHIHHRLLDRGMTQWQALCVLEAFCLTTGAAAAAATLLRSDALAWIVAIGAIALVVYLRLFGHHELRLARLVIARAAGLFTLWLASPEGAASHSLAKSLHGLSFDDGWSLLLAEAQRWGVLRLEVVLALPSGELRRWGWNANDLVTGPASCGSTLTGGDAMTVRYDLTAVMAEAEPIASAAVMQLLRDFAHFVADSPSVDAFITPQTIVLPPKAARAA